MKGPYDIVNATLVVWPSLIVCMSVGLGECVAGGLSFTLIHCIH